MDIVISINQPAHVHLYRYVTQSLQDRGHTVHVFARDDPRIRTLLETYGVEYTAVSRPGETVGTRAVGQAAYEWRLLRHVFSIDPDVMTAVGGLSVAHVSTLVGAHCVVFSDTEAATLRHALAFPLADTICTPTYYRKELGEKQRRYDGIHELFYLYPERFTPDPTVLDEVGVEPGQRYIVLRSDTPETDGDEGTFDDLAGVVDRLEATGARVLITGDGDLPLELADRRIDLPPHRMHDLLYYADLFVGQAETKVSESAVLGTPAVDIGALDSGVTDALDEEYGLVFQHDETGIEEGIELAVDLLEHEEEYDWERRRIELLANVDDPLDVAVNQLCTPA